MGKFEDNKFEIFRVSKNKIKEELITASHHSAKRLSENDILTIYLLKNFVKKWNKAGDRIQIRSAFDFRRVYRDVGRLYFGNAVSIAATDLSFEDVFEKQVWELAELIRDSTSEIRKERILSDLAVLEKYRLENGVQSCQNFHVAHPKFGYLFTNLSRMPLNALNFGLGAPESAYPLVPGPRTLVIMDGGSDYLVRVSPPMDNK